MSVISCDTCKTSSFCAKNLIASLPGCRKEGRGPFLSPSLPTPTRFCTASIFLSNPFIRNISIIHSLILNQQQQLIVQKWKIWAIFLELLLWVGRVRSYPLDSPGPFSNTHPLEGAFIKNCVYNLTQAFLKTFRLFDLQNDNLPLREDKQ